MLGFYPTNLSMPSPSWYMALPSIELLKHFSLPSHPKSKHHKWAFCLGLVLKQSPVSPAQYSSGPIFLHLPNILVQVSTLSYLDDYKQPFWSFCFQSYFPMDISQKPE